MSMASTGAGAGGADGLAASSAAAPPATTAIPSTISLLAFIRFTVNENLKVVQLPNSIVEC